MMMINFRILIDCELYEIYQRQVEAATVLTNLNREFSKAVNYDLKVWISLIFSTITHEVKVGQKFKSWFFLSWAKFFQFFFQFFLQKAAVLTKLKSLNSPKWKNFFG